MMKKLSSIHDEWSIDSIIDKTNIEKELLRIPLIHAKYLQMLSGIRLLINNKKNEYNILTLNKKNWLNGKLSYEAIENFGWKHNPFGNLSKPLKTELDKYVVVDKDVFKIKRDLDILSSCQESLLEIINNITWRTQTLKSIIEWRKFEAGS